MTIFLQLPAILIRIICILPSSFFCMFDSMSFSVSLLFALVLFRHSTQSLLTRNIMNHTIIIIKERSNHQTTLHVFHPQTSTTVPQTRVNTELPVKMESTLSPVAVHLDILTTPVAQVGNIPPNAYITFILLNPKMTMSPHLTHIFRIIAPHTRHRRLHAITMSTWSYLC